jgi:hypothetical protein
VNPKFVAGMTVIRNAMIFLHICKRDDVRDVIGMEPYGSVPREVTGEICCCAAGLLRELHVSLHAANVREQFWICEDVARGLIVKEDPGDGKSFVACGKRHGLMGDHGSIALEF